MGPVGLSPADGYPAVIATRLLFTLGGIMARNTFLAHTLLRAVCPPPPWAEIIGLSWYDPDTGQASPPDFPEAPGGGHNIHLDILDVTTAPVTVHHIGLDDAERAALALTHDGSLDAPLTHDNPHKRRLARAQLIDDQLHRVQKPQPSKPVSPPNMQTLATRLVAVSAGRSCEPPSGPATTEHEQRPRRQLCAGWWPAHRRQHCAVVINGRNSPLAPLIVVIVLSGQGEAFAATDRVHIAPLVDHWLTGCRRDTARPREPYLLC